jgi:hypothetical protein
MLPSGGSPAFFSASLIGLVWSEGFHRLPSLCTNRNSSAERPPASQRYGDVKYHRRQLEFEQLPLLMSSEPDFEPIPELATGCARRLWRQPCGSLPICVDNDDEEKNISGGVARWLFPRRETATVASPVRASSRSRTASYPDGCVFTAAVCFISSQGRW